MTKGKENKDFTRRQKQKFAIYSHTKNYIHCNYFSVVLVPKKLSQRILPNRKPLSLESKKNGSFHSLSISVDFQN